jgi:8-oxo-dGTP pyrophosphatase MutT (NUDIX family)
MTLERARRALVRYAAREISAPEARPAAVALILVEQSGGLEALFIKRAARAGDPWSGQVAFPGGRHDPEDGDLLATAIRETREETGVELSDAERLGVLDDLYPRTPTLPPVATAEVERAFWLPLARIVEPSVRRDVKLLVGGVERVFPAYDLGEDVIWGMTERILTPFLQLLGYGR